MRSSSSGAYRPDALIRYDVSLPDIKERIEANNANAGAQFIVKNDEEYIVRSVGLATDLEALRNIVVKTIDGTPVYLHQLGELDIGGEIRRGPTKDGEGGGRGHGIEADRQQYLPR